MTIVDEPLIDAEIQKILKLFHGRVKGDVVTYNDTDYYEITNIELDRVPAFLTNEKYTAYTAQ